MKYLIFSFGLESHLLEFHFNFLIIRYVQAYFLKISVGRIQSVLSVSKRFLNVVMPMGNRILTSSNI